MRIADWPGMAFVVDAVLQRTEAHAAALWVAGPDGDLVLHQTLGVEAAAVSALDPLRDDLAEVIGEGTVIARTPDGPQGPFDAVLAVRTALPPSEVQRTLDAAREALGTRALLERRTAHGPQEDGILHAISEESAVIDADGVVVQTNSAWEQAPSEVRAVVERSPVGTNYRQALDSQTSRPARLTAEGIDAVLSATLPGFQCDYDTEGDSGGRSFHLQVDPLPSGGAVIRHMDISFRKHLQRQLAHRATHDPLTGLPNRLVMTERLAQALTRAARTDAGLALLFCDVDHFKQINDSMGHGVGDHVLTTIGRRLQESVRQSDVVARFGGDEFVILLEDVEDEQTAMHRAEQLQLATTAPIIVEGRPLDFGVSIGISLHEGVLDADDSVVGALLADADAAMYMAKRSGRGTIRVFEPGTSARVRSGHDVAQALSRSAIDEGVTLQVQPIVSLADRRVKSFESLARIDLPELGTLSPADFLQRAEETGAIVEIGASVMRQALTFVAAQPPEVTVAVNVSWVELSRADYPDRVLAALGEAGVDPYRLDLEVLLPAGAKGQALTHLRTLREAGVGIILDAFGRQPVELAMIPGMAATGMKIDRSLMGAAATDEKSARLVRGIVDLVGNLGLECSAEGIESARQAEVATELGFARGQGYYFGKPMDPQQAPAGFTL